MARPLALTVIQHTQHTRTRTDATISPYQSQSQYT